MTPTYDHHRQPPSPIAHLGTESAIEYIRRVSGLSAYQRDLDNIGQSFRWVPHDPRMRKLEKKRLAQPFAVRTQGSSHPFRYWNTNVGVVLYRRHAETIEVMLIRPFNGHAIWSILRDKIIANEDPLETALRAMIEQAGVTPADAAEPLGHVYQSNCPNICAFAVESGCDAATISDRLHAREGAPPSHQSTPTSKTDAAGWFPIDAAMDMVIPAQHGILMELRQMLEQAT